MEMQIKGKYNTAVVFTDLIDDMSTSQLITLCSQEFAKDSKIRIMPDVHAGMGCTIGTSMTLHGKVCPNMVGVDIGCGMRTAKLKDTEIDFKKLDEVINKKIPHGFNVNTRSHKTSILDDLRCAKHVNLERAYKSIGTLGGGNHFIEVGKGSDGYYLIIHSGSRNIGTQVCKYYQDLAFKRLTCHKDAVEQVIIKCKREKREKDIDKDIKAIKREAVGKDYAYLQGDDFDDYMNDMKIIQEYAVLNRHTIMTTIVKHYGLQLDCWFETIHNYIDTKSMILRKGAVAADKGKVILIPINMRDGSLLCIGKGNEEWNCSAPHGAGRIYSRTAAKKELSMDDFNKTMKDVYSTSVCKSTLDEAPMAYKPIESIINNIGDTVDVVDILKTVYNFKSK